MGAIGPARPADWAREAREADAARGGQGAPVGRSPGAAAAIWGGHGSWCQGGGYFACLTWLR